jgi:hypothetical protein
MPQLNVIQEKTTLKPSVFSLAVGVFLILFSFLIDITGLVNIVACLFVPIYLTLGAIGVKNERIYVKFLMYWMVFGLVEIVLEPILECIFHNTFLMIFNVSLVSPYFIRK